MWYTDLVLATLERSDDLTIGFLMANNPFTLVFTCFLRLFLPSFELCEKEEDPKLSATIPVLLSPQVKTQVTTYRTLFELSLQLSFQRILGRNFIVVHYGVAHPTNSQEDGNKDDVLHGVACRETTLA